MEEPRMCCRKGCGQEGRWKPVIIIPAASALRAALGDLPAEPARLDFPLVLCDRHKESGIEDFLTSDSWEKIKLQFHRAGRVPPDHKDLRLKFEPIGEHQDMLKREVPLSFKGVPGKPR